MKRFLTTIIALLLLATCAWSADTVQVMQGGKILPQYLGINATGSVAWNSTTGALTYSAESGRLRRITVYTANATYEKPSWLKFVIVKGVGAGGGSGGTPASNATARAISGGGGGGGYFEKFILASALSASETVTVGVAGIGGAAGANNGTAGGTTSFGAHCSATGGNGSPAGVLIEDAGRGDSGRGIGGTATGGDINIAGEPGRFASLYMSAFLGRPVSGRSVLSATVEHSFNTTGRAGDGYGGGAGGIFCSTNQAAQAGGNGTGGIVIVEEYE